MNQNRTPHLAITVTIVGMSGNRTGGTTISEFSYTGCKPVPPLAGLFGDIDLAARAAFAGIDLSAFPCGLTDQKAGFTGTFDFAFTAILHIMSIL